MHSEVCLLCLLCDSRVAAEKTYTHRALLGPLCAPKVPQKCAKSARKVLNCQSLAMPPWKAQNWSTRHLGIETHSAANKQHSLLGRFSLGLFSSNWPLFTHFTQQSTFANQRLSLVALWLLSSCSLRSSNCCGVPIPEAGELQQVACSSFVPKFVFFPLLAGWKAATTIAHIFLQFFSLHSSAVGKNSSKICHFPQTQTETQIETRSNWVRMKICQRFLLAQFFAADPIPFHFFISLFLYFFISLSRLALES